MARVKFGAAENGAPPISSFLLNKGSLKEKFAIKLDEHYVKVSCEEILRNRSRQWRYNLKRKFESAKTEEEVQKIEVPELIPVIGIGFVICVPLQNIRRHPCKAYYKLSGQNLEEKDVLLTLRLKNLKCKTGTHGENSDSP